jgi:SAM-dependent methyltransferase
MASPRELEARWDGLVRANREQVERCRRVPEASDFYAPVTGRYVHDPRRSDDAVLDALLRRAHRAETWLDIGAGAGRYALPLALALKRVIAVDASPAMLDALRAGMAQHRIENIDVVAERWPPSTEPPDADVALIAHVGYDIEPIGPFLAAMEAAAPRRVAVLMDRSPATYASPFWPPIHGEERAELPGCPQLLELLRARGCDPSLEQLPQPPRRWPDEETLLEMLRQQLWIAPGGDDERRLRDAIAALAVRDSDGIGLREDERWIGVVEWGV